VDEIALQVPLDVLVVANDERRLAYGIIARLRAFDGRLVMLARLVRSTVSSSSGRKWDVTVLTGDSGPMFTALSPATEKLAAIIDAVSEKNADGEPISNGLTSGTSSQLENLWSRSG
jgi:dihydroorotate dehydrogenase